MQWVPSNTVWGTSYFHGQIARLLPASADAPAARENRYNQYRMIKEDALARNDQHALRFHHFLYRDQQLSHILTQMLRHDVEVAYLAATANSVCEEHVWK